MNILNPSQIAQQLIEEYSIKSPADLELETIANAEGLIVEEDNLDGHLGRISFSPSFGLIKIDKKIPGTGRKNFTLAHEIGHYLNEKDLKKSFTAKCTSNDLLSFKINKRREDDANIFAAELLMHKPWFGDFIKKRAINFDLIKDIAEHFNVSLTAAAIRYAEIGKYPTAVILSRNGKKVWSFMHDYFPFKYIPKDYAVKKESSAYDYFAGKEVQTCDDLVRASTWFGDDYKCQNREDVYLYEQNIVMKSYNSVLTLLWESEFK